MLLIRCRDLSFGYGGNAVVRGLNFTVAQGDYLCVAGENGSGKTTLIKGLLGLTPPLGGGLSIEGLEAGDIGYLGQERQVKRDFPASVSEVVLSGRLGRSGWRPFYSQRDREAAMEYLELLGIGELRRRSYRELSGGQQQRALLARALCGEPKLIIMDEVGAGLDPLVTAQVYAILDRINRERGVTIIMVSHDVAASLAYARTVLHLKNEQRFFGGAAEYAASPLGRAFMEAPVYVTGNKPALLEGGL